MFLFANAHLKKHETEIFCALFSRTFEDAHLEKHETLECEKMIISDIEIEAVVVL